MAKKRSPLPQRAFLPEFLEYARAMAVLPPEPFFNAWCRERNIAGMQHGVYGRLRKGMPSLDEHVRRLLECMLDPRYQAHPERKALDDYLRTVGGPDPRGLGTAAVLNLISTNKVAGEDGMGIGAKVLLWLFRGIVKPAEHVRVIPVTKGSLVREGILWRDTDNGRQLTTPSTPTFDALDAYAAHTGISLAEYQQKALAWWREEPWTVVLAVNQQEVKGVCIALPVTKEFYERARSGQCASHECTPEDIECPSPYVIVEGISPVTDSEGKRDPGLSLITAALCQQAFVSHVKGLALTTPLRLLSSSFTPVAKSRLKRFGYTPVGTVWPGTNIEYMERVLSMRGRGYRDGALCGMWQALQLCLQDLYRKGPFDGEPPAGGDTRERDVRGEEGIGGVGPTPETC